MNQQGAQGKFTAEDILKEAEARIAAEQAASQDAHQTNEQGAEGLGYLPVPPPFPVDAFPLPCQQVIQEIAAAYAVPVEVPIAALLSASGACIGRTRGIVIKSGWREFANLWIADVGVSGLGKSPATMELFHPIWQHETDVPF